MSVLSIRTLFIEGGAFGMTILSIEFILLILAAWKAPAWVKEIGLLALMTGAFWTMLGLYQMSDVLGEIGDVSTAILAGGFKVAMISALYGGIIYMVSLVIRIIQKPRI